MVGYILNNLVNALASNCTSHCNRFLSCIYGPAFLLKSTKDFPYFVDMCRVYGLPDNIKLPATYKHCQLFYIHHDTFLPPVHLADQLTWWLIKHVFLVWALSVFSEHILGICTSTIQTIRLCFLADWDLYMPLKLVLIPPGNYRSIGYQVIIWNNKKRISVESYNTIQGIWINRRSFSFIKNVWNFCLQIDFEGPIS